jgi:transcriptional regulator with XRE-family HTH domain
LRELREARGLALWEVAHEARMDSTRLSKIELGQRLPTADQVAALAKFFGVNHTELESMRIAEKILTDHDHNSAAFALAAARIHESAGEYLVKRKPIGASKARKR